MRPLIPLTRWLQGEIYGTKKAYPRNGTEAKRCKETAPSTEEALGRLGGRTKRRWARTEEEHLSVEESRWAFKELAPITRTGCNVSTSSRVSLGKVGTTTGERRGMDLKFSTTTSVRLAVATLHVWLRRARFPWARGRNVTPEVIGPVPAQPNSKVRPSPSPRNRQHVCATPPPSEQEVFF
ncbi:hypothetical protein B296_00040987 [Ensete ventricosum]|uniref:Uncharacterized protein n=1 Tax=Ensete ventricosum TaxID=4639 RepID=A0A426YB54_ENSVE|nr:hypothetical protein B296_00040987 [Ensete ventricosum]